MRRSGFFVLGAGLPGLLLSITSGFAAVAETAPATHPATLEDVLSVEALGDAAFSPDGAWLAWNQIPPYGSLSDYSYYLRAYGLSGHQLWIRNLETGETALQPGLDPAATNFLFGFSPDSAFVVVLEHWRGRLRFVACRTGQDSCTRFDPMPDIRDKYIAGGYYNERLVWTAPHRFIMPVRDPFQPGSEMRSRGTAGAFLAEAWTTAWAGKTPTVSEVRSVARPPNAEWADGDLLEFDLEAGLTRQVTRGRYAGLRLSPDGRWSAAARTGERIRPDADAAPVPEETHPLFDRRYAIQLIDVRTGRTVPVETPWSIDPHSISWSARGDRLAVFGWAQDEAPVEGRFYLIDRDGQSAGMFGQGALRLENGHPNPRYMWWAGPARAALLDDGLAVLARDSEDSRPHWYLLATGGAPPTRLTGALDHVGGDLLAADTDAIVILADGRPVRVGGDGRLQWLAGKDGPIYRPLLYRSNMAHAWSPEYRLASPLIRHDLTGDITLVAADPAGNDAAILHTRNPESAVTPVRLPVNLDGARAIAASLEANALLASVKDGASTRLMLLRHGEPAVELAHINQHLERVRDPEILEIDYTLHDPAGELPLRKTSACMLLPPGFEKGRRYPVLVNIYPGGGPGACRPLGEAAYAGAIVDDLWASRGFIHISPAFPLDLAETPESPVGGLGNLLDQTIMALEEQGYADPDRVVLFGFSQGGMASLAAAADSDRIAAVISMNGWADFFSHYFGPRGLMRYFHLDQNGGDNRWRYECSGQGASHRCPFGFGVSALEDPAAYAAASPVARARNITAPILLVHSDLDYFDMSQYDEMFGALYRAGKDVRYVRYWGEGHGPSSPANIRDLWGRIDDFLAEYGLMPGD